ncbi:MAG: MFS transporter, partial [Clostridia bacterium]|nr:MFS transporter [Clostridia bacterium]
MKKLGGKFWASLVIFSLTGQIAWVIENMYFNVFIYKMFGADPGAISAMVASSAISATLTTIFIGALSDKIGKRKIFISGGYILWGISILSFALIRLDVINAVFPAAVSAMSIGVSLVIIMDCVMTFFGSSANDACFNAWLTDMTEDGGRGKAEGINSMMPLLAVLAVFGGFMAFDLNKVESWTLIYIIIGVSVILIGVLGIFIIDESTVKIESNNKYFQNTFYGFRPKVIKENKTLYVSLICFAIFGISIQIFMPYLILYYNVSLKMDNYVLIMAPAIILAAIFTALYGKVYDKKGFKNAVIPATLLLSLGFVILFFFKDT